MTGEKAERGLTGASTRGGSVREAWVRAGILVSREHFAERLGISVQELARAVAKGELFERSDVAASGPS
jgi:DNA-binding transcriptional regulator YiaG